MLASSGKSVGMLAGSSKGFCSYASRLRQACLVAMLAGSAERFFGMLTGSGKCVGMLADTGKRVCWYASWLRQGCL